MKQASSHIFMLRPLHFGYDPETASSNAFQIKEGAEQQRAISLEAIKEFDAAVGQLEKMGIQVSVLHDSDEPIKPNAIFPNNWVSFHQERVILYPMMAESRRAERRLELIEELKRGGHPIEEVIDLSEQELQGKFLESTGSIVFDYEHQLAYACLSERTDAGLLKELCDLLGYEPIIFHAKDKDGVPIYHTNVMMCLASKFAVVCLECIDESEREVVRAALMQTGHELIELSLEQVYAFAGNMLEVVNELGQAYLVMSQTAYNALEMKQIEVIEQYAEVISVAIPTIEKYGGGSIRCMICRIS